MKYIDVHCHLNFTDYDADREETIARARTAGVGMIVVGTGKETSRKAVELAEANDDIWAIVGLHPIHVSEEMGKETFDHDFYLKLAQHPKVVGIGECGFDYFRTDGTARDHELQREAFLGQIAIANQVNKPLMLHLRNTKNKSDSKAQEAKTGGNAYRDALDILKNPATKLKVKGDAHFFAGNWGEAKEFLDLDFNLSFNGVITFTRDYDEVIRNAPIDRIMSETDAPYVTPVPHRGKRNEPSYVVEAAHAIAAIRGEPLEMVLPHLVDNARRLFGF